MRSVVFASHAEVRVDASIEVTRWGLSPRGIDRTAALARSPLVREVQAVWSSAERKAAEAAGMIADAKGLEAMRLDALGENDRSATGFLPPPEFEATADAFFAEPGTSVRGWETAAAAQVRITDAVSHVLADPRSGDGDVLIVSHGAVGTLLLCHLLAVPITRSRDQPHQGCVLVFDRDTLEVRHGWRPYESARNSRTGGAELTDGRGGTHGRAG